MENLELKHLAPYLPYGLKFTDSSLKPKWTLMPANISVFNYDYHKPILRPLSDFNHSDAQSEIQQEYSIGYNSGGFSDSITENFEAKWLPQYAFNIMCKHHFDVFGLIKQGLAIDINSL